MRNAIEPLIGVMIISSLAGIVAALILLADFYPEGCRKKYKKIVIIFLTVAMITAIASGSAIFLLSK